MLVTLSEPSGTGDRVAMQVAGDVTIATWMGPGGPASGDSDVELDIEETVPWESIALTDEQEGLGRDGEQAVVRGTVVDVSDDGVLTLRVRGSILMVDTDGEPRGDVEGRVVVVRTSDLRAFPTGL